MTTKGDGEMYVMMISTHSPESCPIHNKETRKVMQTVIKRVPVLADKHGITITGIWTSIETHTTYVVCDTPSLDAFMAYGQEPDLAGWVSFNCIQSMAVLSREETDALLG